MGDQREHQEVQQVRPRAEGQDVRNGPEERRPRIRWWPPHSVYTWRDHSTPHACEWCGFLLLFVSSPFRSLSLSFSLSLVHHCILSSFPRRVVCCIIWYDCCRIPVRNLGSGVIFFRRIQCVAALGAS